MKYLKIFEKFNGFREISYGSRGPASEGVEKFFASNLDIFTDVEFDQIKSLLRKYRVDKFELEQGSYEHPIGVGTWIPYKDTSMKKYIKVEKYKDEWFQVTDYPFFYECDQINGVIKCLKTLLPNKVDESLDVKNNYYYKVTQDEFDNTIQNPDIYFLSNSEILTLKNFVGKDFMVETEDASLITGGKEWLISDNWGLDKWFESEEIRIHDGDSIKSHKLSETSEDDVIVVKNFTMRIKPNNEKETIDIMKCSDDWFLACVGMDDGSVVNWEEKMYKCDQLDGVIKFIKDMYEIY
jgi:hypothetical protein